MDLHNPNPDKLDAAVIRLITNGRTLTEVADGLCISRETLSASLKRVGYRERQEVGNEQD